MTRKKYLLFATMTALLAVVLSLAGMIAVDLYCHYKFRESAGLNIWGYRGPVVGRKKSGERRVVVLGESQTFGYGVHWQETIPAYLEEALNRAPRQGGPISVVNLGANGDAAHAYAFTLDDYRYLGYDAVVFYSGYSDVGGYNPGVMRHDSVVFRKTGYMPILPLILREKSMALMYGGHLEDAYKGRATTFKPNAVDHTAANVLDAAATVSEAMERRTKIVEQPSARDAAVQDGAACGTKWAYYCGGMYRAVKYALDHQKQVLVVTQPYVNDSHIDEQRQLIPFLTERFAGNPRLRFANLGDALDLKDASVSWDGFHLNVKGNRLVAEKLAAPVSEILR